MKKKKLIGRPPTPEELGEFFRAIQLITLEEMRADYKKGAKLKLLEAAVWCGKCGIKLPAWITTDLKAALERYQTFEGRTLDEAFGVPPRRKGIHTRSINEFWRKAFPVFMRVSELRSKGEKTDDASGLFEGVAAEFDINTTLAKEYYYRCRKLYGTIFMKRKNPPSPSSLAGCLASS